MLMYKKDCDPVDVLPSQVPTMEHRGWTVAAAKEPVKKIAKPTTEEFENGDN
tara:strand:- start:115 stop:270 length:156 start_codon:yes stop_codon:yes gene_type:complete